MGGGNHGLKDRRGRGPKRKRSRAQATADPRARNPVGEMRRCTCCRNKKEIRRKTHVEYQLTTKGRGRKSISRLIEKFVLTKEVK